MKNSHFKIALVLIAIMFMYYATSIVHFDDVSNEYEELINTTYKTKSEMFIYGINMDNPIGNDIDEYILWKPPGLSGREVISKGYLPVGSIIKINKILKCNDCYLSFKPRIKSQITILSSNNYNDHNVYSNSSSVVKLNPNDFELMNAQ